MNVSNFSLSLSFFCCCCSKCQRACEKLDLDASIEQPIMKFFWPIRKTAELSETVEDPYEEKSRVQPKRKRVKLISSSSDDDDDDDDSNLSGRKCKRFGTDLDSDKSSSSESSSGEDEEGGVSKTTKIEEIITIDPNDDEDNEFEVSFFTPVRYTD